MRGQPPSQPDAKTRSSFLFSASFVVRVFRRSHSGNDLKKDSAPSQNSSTSACYTEKGSPNPAENLPAAHY